MADILIVNAATGEVLERAFTAVEKKQRAADLAAAEEREAVEADRAAARASAIGKLSALGLDESEVAALLGGSL